MINTIENGSSVRVVELPKSDRIKAEQAKVASPVALTGKADNEIDGIAALERMFKSAVIGYARKFQTLREAIETCQKAGVSDKQMGEWAEQVGYSIQTFRNVMSNIRKDTGEMLKVVKKEDRRLARNRETPEEKSVLQYCHDYLLQKTGSLAKAEAMALKLSRRFNAEKKEAAKS